MNPDPEPRRRTPAADLESVAAYDYELPEDLIAQAPLPERSASRMMVVDRTTGGIAHHRASDLPEFLRAGDLLVVNDTRVIPARLFGEKEGTGGKVELLLLEEAAPDTWTAMFRASRPAAVGSRLRLADGRIGAEILERTAGGRVRVRLTADGPARQAIEQWGRPPLPPYIKRPDAVSRAGDGRAAQDRERYQTVYAREPGAVAAPTAGLHLSEPLLASLAAKGVERADVTLHVGPGTFKPVTADRAADHVMEEERYEVPAATADRIRSARDRGGRIVAVGTTTVRTLESTAGPDGVPAVGRGRTDLFIRPPYRFRCVDALLTNFHLPKSTLIMMICALAGYDLVTEAYRIAVAEKYRFYSYGDCMLVL